MLIRVRLSFMMIRIETMTVVYRGIRVRRSAT